MRSQNLFVSSHAPFWHDMSSFTVKNYNIMLAALPAAIFGICQYGAPALGVIGLSVSCAMLWELIMNLIMKKPVSIGNGSAALTGLLFAMLLPATTPWWAVLTGTFAAIVIGREIFGGAGCNPFNPVLIAFAILMLSWKGILTFDEALVNYDFGFCMIFPLGAVKHFGAAGAANYDIYSLLMGQQTGGIGAVFGLGLIIGGLYLILRGYIRWEISLAFLSAVFVTANIFHIANSSQYASPMFHILTGYTLIGAFFLATEDSSSPVNFIPMLIYGATAGVLTVLIRNIGAFTDGVVLAVLMMNVANPLLDKIRPKAMGGKTEHA
jgi:electron transport complex protein RnfD